MLYSDLHQRYGNHIAARIQRELNTAEFRRVEPVQLQDYLVQRAEAAHRAYCQSLDNPLALLKSGAAREGDAVSKLYNRWREAEDLAYLLMVAEDVSAHTKASLHH